MLATSVAANSGFLMLCTTMMSFDIVDVNNNRPSTTAAHKRADVSAKWVDLIYFSITLAHVTTLCVEKVWLMTDPVHLHSVRLECVVQLVYFSLDVIASRIMPWVSSSSPATLGKALRCPVRRGGERRYLEGMLLVSSLSSGTCFENGLETGRMELEVIFPC